jgi:hypothetical protein
VPAVPKFLDYAPDQDRVAPLAPEVAAAIEIASFVRYAASSNSYGVTPLDFAPRPNSLARSWFPDALLDGHLAALAALQQDDGGWPVAWEPPTEDAHRAWRGIQTLAAITTLVAYVKAQD